MVPSVRNLNAVAVSAVAALSLLALALLSDFGGSSPVAAGTQIELDAYRADDSPANVTGPFLEDSAQYMITIQGTWSFWFAVDWENHGVCRGVPEDMPMFPSPGTMNGPVGADAAWDFASINNFSDCGDPVPDDRDFDVSLDGGTTMVEIEPVDPGVGPNAEHSYTFMVTGAGDNIVFFLNDEKTVDNYGILMITISEVQTPTPSPAGEMLVWGDDNCSGAADPVDSLLTLRFDAGLNTNTGDCPELGQVVEVALASPHPWGDVDCSGAVDPVDSLKLLRYDAGLSVSQEEGCPEIGSGVLVS
jgi:hypothetical protein